MTKITYPNTSASHVENLAYRYADGQLASLTDENSQRTSYTYNDSLGRLTETDYPDGGRTTVTYDDLAPTPSVTTNKLLTTASSLSMETVQDGAGHVIRTQLASDPSGVDYRDTSYDGLGRVWALSNPYRSASDATYGITTYTYDSLGRTTQVRTGDGAVVSTTYAGPETSVTDQAGDVRQTWQDALARITTVVEDPGSSAHLNYRTTYSYDALNDLTQVTQGAEGRSFYYDSLGRLTEAVQPESGTTLYRYDSNGNLIWKQDGRRVQISYGYDALNRITSKSYTNTTPTVSYAYDTGVGNAVGRLTQVTNTNSTTNYTGFDALGRVTGSNQVTGGQTYSFAYGYNLAGSLTSETYPSGRVATTGYDGADRANALTGSVAGQSKTYVGWVSYWPQGAEWGLGYGNNVVPVYVYSNRLQPSQIYATIGNSGNSYLTVLNYNWGTTNNNGNLQSASEGYGNAVPYSSLSWLNQSYTYDGVNRLTNVSDSGYSRSFGYDAYGNAWVTGNSGVPLAGNTPTSANAFNGNNQIGGTTYDLAGNQLAVNGDTMAYDAENRQISATEPPALGGGTEQYLYDGDGQRVEKSWPGGTTVYVYDALGRLAAEYGTNGPPSPCTTCYLAGDHLGTPRLVTDQNADVIARHDYLPFGEEIPGNTAGRNGLWGPQRDTVNQKFTGQERDTESGLDYFGARYYGSALGRFTGPDAFTVTPARVADPQQLNLYAYGRNNPLKYIDPTGMIIDDSACQADKNCARKWQQIQNIANQQDKNGNYLHPELQKVLSTLQSDSRTFALENSKLSPGTAGLFTITNFTNDGKDFTRATLQLDFKQIQGISNVTGADLVPGFSKYQGLLDSPIDRLAETFGHEGAHGLFSIENPAQAVGIQQTLNDRDAAMQNARYPYPPDVMQKIDAANKALIPTEKFAQQIEKIINGELQADKKKQ